MYLRSDGYEEYKAIFGFIGPFIYGAIFNVVSKISNFISCSNYNPIEIETFKLLHAGRLKAEKEIALENYRQRLRKEVSAIYVCRPQDNHRWVSVSSDSYQNKYKKKYEYY